MTLAIPEAPPFSILALGHHLGAMKHEAYLLELLTTRLGSEKTHSPLDATRLEQRQAENARKAVEDHIDALEALLLRSRATCPGDAVVQIMLAAAAIGSVEASKRDSEQEDDRLQTAHAALQSAMRAVAPAAGVRLVDIGGRYYSASAWCDGWPSPDLSGLEPEIRPAADHCIDGSGGVA